jgi:hypothetical protein
VLPLLGCCKCWISGTPGIKLSSQCQYTTRIAVSLLGLEKPEQSTNGVNDGNGCEPLEATFRGFEDTCPKAAGRVRYPRTVKGPMDQCWDKTDTLGTVQSSGIQQSRRRIKA